jgi:CRISPR/Cas system Type II protein with McrA/HNH and RuvC-like nuclease domain
MASGSELSFRLKARLFQAQGGLCAYCFRPLNPRFNRQTIPLTELASIDHVFPRSRFPDVPFPNKVLVHQKPCNRDKADRLPTGCELLALAWVWARMGQLYGWDRATGNHP